MSARAKLDAILQQVRSKVEAGETSDPELLQKGLALIADEGFVQQLVDESATTPEVPAEPAATVPVIPALQKGGKCSCGASTIAGARTCPECGSDLAKSLVPGSAAPDATQVVIPAPDALRKSLAIGFEEGETVYDLFPVIGEIGKALAASSEASTALQDRVLKSLHLLHARLDQMEARQVAAPTIAAPPAVTLPAPDGATTLKSLQDRIELLTSAMDARRNLPHSPHPMGKSAALPGIPAAEPMAMDKTTAIQLIQKGVSTNSIDENRGAMALRTLDACGGAEWGQVVQRHAPAQFAEWRTANAPTN